MADKEPILPIDLDIPELDANPRIYQGVEADGRHVDGVEANNGLTPDDFDDELPEPTIRYPAMNYTALSAAIIAVLQWKGVEVDETAADALSSVIVLLAGAAIHRRVTPIW